MTISWRRRVAPPLFFLTGCAALMLPGCGGHHDDPGTRSADREEELRTGAMPDRQTLQRTFGKDFAAAAAGDRNGPPVPVTPDGGGQVNAQAEPIQLDRH